MNQLLRIFFTAVVLLALGGEGWFVYSTHAELARLTDETTALRGELASNTAFARTLASTTDALTLRTKAIEMVATKEIAGFQTSLAAAQKEQSSLQSALASEARARQIAEASSKASSLAASAQIESLRQQLSTSISATDLSTIIATWRPRVAKVQCRIGSSIATGSGTVMSFNDATAQGIGALTNRHVIYGGSSGTTPPTSCDVTLPGSGSTATAFLAKAQIQVDKNGGLDFGRLMLDSPSGAFASVTATDPKQCTETPKLGDTLLILGYPSIGSTADVTATDGIISGFDGDYYITSAKVERGNSGGAAVLVKNNCLLGVPTFVVAGGIESLARILDIRAIAK